MDLAAYFQRIGYDATPALDRPSLFALHRAHATTVPFENLSIQIGEPVRLDLETLEDKLVRRRRGGYCFEHNTLLQAALRTIGFDVIACEARVRTGTTELRARTHMVLVVRLDSVDWLCDVGFGGEGPLEPVPMSGAEVEQPLGAYRVVREKTGADAIGLCVLQNRDHEGWGDLYAFEPLARAAVDFEVANWYTSTSPRSVFVTGLTAQALREGQRHILRGLTYTRRDAHAAATREIDRADLTTLLREVFGLDFPADTKFKALDEPSQ